MASTLASSAPFGSLLPMDTQFEQVVAKITAPERAATQALDGTGQRPPSREEWALLRAAYCLLGKDEARVAALCQQQIPDLEEVWRRSGGPSDGQLCSNVDAQQRIRLANALVNRLAHEGGDSTTGALQQLSSSKARELQELAQHGYVGEMVDSLLGLFTARDIQAALVPLVKVMLLDAGANGEHQGYQEGASEDETMADAGAQDVHCTPGCNNSRDDVVIEANSILSPPDSNTTGGLGTADAAVSLALHCTSAMHKAQVTPGGTVQCKAVDYKPHWQLHADGSDSLIKAELKSEEVATSDAVAAEQDMRQTGPAFVMGTTYGETNPHATPPTPLHNRRPSRPSTPQRQSPSDGMVKICSNCTTTATPLWRKEGNVLLCNACGIYFKTHGFHRPVDLIRAAATTGRRESGGAGAVAGGSSGGARSSTPTGRGRPPVGPAGPGGVAGGETPLASSELGLSGVGGPAHLHGDTATSPPHRRRRSSPSPLRYRSSLAVTEGSSGGRRQMVGATAHAEGSGMFPDDQDEDALSDGPGHSGNVGVSGGASRRSARRPAPRASWQEEESGGRQRRASSGAGLPLPGLVAPSSHGKRSRFGEQFLGGNVGFHSAPGSEYGDDMEPMLHLTLGDIPLEGSAGNHTNDVTRRLPQPTQLGREFSFGMDGVALEPAGPKDTRNGVPTGPTPRLPTGPANDAARRAGDEALAAADGAFAPRRPCVSDVSVSEQGTTGLPQVLQERPSMETEDASDLTIEHDPAAVAAVLLGLKNALVINEDNEPAPGAAGAAGPQPEPISRLAGPRSAAGSGRSSPYNKSPMRGRRGAAALGASDRGYWSGPEDTASGRPTKRSRSPMTRVANTDVGGGSGAASGRTSPAHSTGAGASEGKPPQTCYNCGTTKTPLWRKDKETGESMCNACGIYKQTHGFHRPYRTMEKDGAGGSGASAPISVPRGKGRQTASNNSHGAVASGGTPPGGGAGSVGAGGATSQRRGAAASTLAGGRPPLPPPALPMRAVGSQPPPSHFPSHLSHPPPTSGDFSTQTGLQGTASVAQGAPAQGIPWMQPPGGMPLPGPGNLMLSQPGPVMAPWPFYQLQLPGVPGAPGSAPQGMGQLPDGLNPLSLPQLPFQQQSGFNPPAAAPVKEDNTAHMRSKPSEDSSTTAAPRAPLAAQSASDANRPPPPTNRQLPPAQISFKSLMEPVVGLPTPNQGQQPQPAVGHAAGPAPAQGGQAMPPPAQGAPAIGSPVRGPPGRPYMAQGVGLMGQQLGVPAPSGSNLRPQLSTTAGSGGGPALGMPADPSQALQAAAALAAALQAHQQTLASASRADGGMVAGAPAGAWPGSAPHPFLASVYSAQHHLQQYQQQMAAQQQQAQPQYPGAMQLGAAGSGLPQPGQPQQPLPAFPASAAATAPASGAKPAAGTHGQQ